MKIGIEAQRIFRENKHGMDFVVLETIRHLQKLDKTNEYFIFISPGTDICLEATKNFHIISLHYPTYPLWEQIALAKAIKKYKLDILHCTSNTAPIKCNIPLVLTLHDIIFLESRSSSNRSWYQRLGWYYRRLIVPRILNKCIKIITVSDFERKNIITKLSVGSKQIVSIYNGYSSHFKKITNFQFTINKYINQTDYLFFLGNTDPKKNTLNVLLAYNIYLQNSKIKRPLLIADLSEKAINSILKNADLENLKAHLYYPGYISNLDLPAIYNGAFAFLYPSLRESFGIPIIESMACGTPVVTSNVSAMPEIAQSNAMLVNPYDPTSIANAVLELEENNKLYNNLISKGLEHSKIFSWNKTATSILNIYENISID